MLIGNDTLSETDPWYKPRMRRTIFASVLASSLLFLPGCSEETSPEPKVYGVSGTHFAFDPAADLTAFEQFYAFPYPSDARLSDRGTPDLRGLPYPSFLIMFGGIRKAAMDHPGFPTVPVAYFAFSAPLPGLDAKAVIPAQASSPILLMDIDEASPNRGQLIPTVATLPPLDTYVVENLLAAAPYPGFVLQPKRRYAFIVKRDLGDANGDLLGVPALFDELRQGGTPESDQGPALASLYKPLWPALQIAGIDANDVAAATVFTTGDVVEETAKLSDAILASYSVSITGVQVDPDDGASHPRYCELLAKVTYPQFQKGTPPFDAEGLFEFGQDGLPIKQRDEEAPVTLTLPLGQMPQGGYPLVLYFHGSGGLSSAIADRGTWAPTSDPTQCPGGTTDEWEGVMGCNKKGEGPAHVLAPHGFAMAASALPVNPERLPGAEETAYLNFNNLAAGRDTFRQGVIEQRLFLKALQGLTIDPATVAACGLTLPAGETSYHFKTDVVYAQGQSMGGMYTNLIGAVEPTIGAAVPTGAGGYWSHFILVTTLVPNAASTVGTILLGTNAELTFMHPALQVFQTAWEAVDPMVSMVRLAQRPLPGHPVRSIYEPVGMGDSYFPTVTYDAMATAYAHKQAGDEVWPTMQASLAQKGLDGILGYPVSDDATSEDGTKYTGVVVQYMGDGVYDPHAIYSQLDAVKYQYGCFLETARKGKAVVPAPAPFGTACP